MKRFVIAVLASLVLSGCASHPEVLEGNAHTVVVDCSDAKKINGALAEADKFCARYGKVAQYKGMMAEFQYAYDCVPGESGPGGPEPRQNLQQQPQPAQ
jgi:starvation-inducible outer membrane lipoprotein